MPTVSIISGAYNIENCFSYKKSIESVLSQTFSDFEFIICDDGSSDKTYDILSEYAELDSRIKLIRNEQNLGLAASLNKCIDIAQGDFIARHDCDDYSAPERIEKQLSYMLAHPDVSLLGTASYLFDEDGVFDEEHFPLEVTNQDFLFTSPYKHGSVMFRKDVLIKAGGYRVAKETYRTEDYDLFMTLQTFAKGKNLDEPLYYFCDNRGTKNRRKYKYRIDEAKVRAKGFKKLGLLPRGIPYIIKPLIVGLIPSKILQKAQSKRRADVKKKNYEQT